MWCLTGERFGRLTVLELFDTRPRKWRCRCDCNNQKIATTGDLRKGLVKSCGCLYRENLAARCSPSNFTGQRFNNWTVIESVKREHPGNWWRLQCDCGYTRVNRAGLFLQYRCPQCVQQERKDKKDAKKAAQKLIPKVRQPRRNEHGHANYAKGVSLTYNTWQAMKHRCLYPKHTNYPSYGGRGIKICSRWLDFRNFLTDMGERPSQHHTIDRINNDGHYEPTNCRWATEDEQKRNRRLTSMFSPPER